MNIRKICILIFIIWVMLVLTGCSKDTKNIETEKGISEINFLENRCITIFNNFSSGEYYKDGEPDFEKISLDYSELKNSEEVILIDLASLKISSESLINLKNCFNDLDLLFQNKDIDGFIKRICDTYNLVSTDLLDKLSDDEEQILEKKAKSDFLYIGYYIDVLNKQEALNSIEIFEESYSALSKNDSYIENNSFKINRIFLKIQDLKSFVNNEEFGKAKEEWRKILDFQK